MSPLTQNLALSINSPGATPALTGNPRIIRIQNTGAIPANNVQVSASGLPANTSITSNTCTGILNPGATCDITLTPGANASMNATNTACTLAPGTEPVSATVTVNADDAMPTNINALVLGYGCIYQGGFIFSVDDTTPNTGSISGKVTALTDETTSLPWAVVTDNTQADSLTNGFANTNALATPLGQYPAAQACLNKSNQGFSDWFMPAICELGRYVTGGFPAGCNSTSPNLYTTLHTNNLGGFVNGDYWSSTEYSGTSLAAWYQNFSDGNQAFDAKSTTYSVRSIRAFTP